VAATRRYRSLRERPRLRRPRPLAVPAGARRSPVPPDVLRARDRLPVGRLLDTAKLIPRRRHLTVAGPVVSRRLRTTPTGTKPRSARSHRCTAAGDRSPPAGPTTSGPAAAADAARPSATGTTPDSTTHQRDLRPRQPTMHELERPNRQQVAQSARSGSENELSPLMSPSRALSGEADTLRAWEIMCC
jgi:hypothetical protein